MNCIKCDYPLTTTYEKKIILTYLFLNVWLGCEKCGYTGTEHK